MRRGHHKRSKAVPSPRPIAAVLELMEPRLLFASTATAALNATGGTYATHLHAPQLIVAQSRAIPADSEGSDAPASAPSITQPAAMNVAAGALFSYQVLATGNPAPSIHLTGAPLGMRIRKGVITWAPAAKDIGVHQISIVAKNALGKRRKTFTLTVTTDLTPPSSPVVSVGTDLTTSSISLIWTPSSDNIAVAGYRVFTYTPAKYRGHSGRDGGYTLVSPAKFGLIADHITSSSYTVSELAPGTTYQYAVAAYDAAGNQSGYSIISGSTLIGPSLSYSSDSSNTNPPVSIAVGQSLYLTLFASGNPAPALALKSAPAGVVFTPGQITNSQLTFVVPHLTWTPTADQVGVRSITMEATNSVGTFSLVISVTVTPK